MGTLGTEYEFARLGLTCLLALQALQHGPIITELTLNSRHEVQARHVTEAEYDDVPLNLHVSPTSPPTRGRQSLSVLLLPFLTTESRQQLPFTRSSFEPLDEMGILILLAQCVAMFVASFLAGTLPLMFKSAMSGEFSLILQTVLTSVQERGSRSSPSSGWVC